MPDRPKTFSPLDYLFVLRPILLVPAWTMLLVGHYRAGGINQMTWLLPAQLWWTIILYSGLMGAVYILNQIYDVETDRLNQKLFLVAEGYVSIPAISLEALVLFLASVSFAFSVFTPLYGLLVLLSAALGILYSVPPFKFKGRPFLDTLANGLGYGLLAFGTGWLAVEPTSALAEHGAGVMLKSSLPYVLAVSAVYVNTTLPDYQSDKATGNITTGVFLGGTATVWLGLALMAASAGLSILLRDRLCLVASGCALPLFLVAAVTGRMRWVMLSYQGGALLLVALTGFIFPAFFIMLAVTYLALKFYHKWRFGMDYPRFADRG